MLIKPTLLLVCAAVALARDAVLSRGVFHGRDTTDPEATPVEIFEKSRNHATAAASVMRFLGDELGFTPHQSSPAELNKSFDEWMTSVVTFKGFQTAGPPLSKKIKLEGGRDKVEENLMREIEWMPDAQLMAREISGLIPGSNDDRDLKEFGLHLLMIQKFDTESERYGGYGRRGPHRPDDRQRDKNKVLLRFFSLELKLDTAIIFKWVTVPDQKARISYLEFEVDKSFLALHAADLAERTSKSLTTVEDMMWFFTSPKQLTSYDVWPKLNEQVDEELDEEMLDREQLRFVYHPRRNGRRILEWLKF